MHFFKVKLTYFSIIAVFAILLLLGLAQLGSTVNPVPKNLPVLIVQQDQGAAVPGKEMKFGEQIAGVMTATKTPAGTDSPIEWAKAASEEEAVDAMNREKAFAAIILPSDFSQKLASMMTSAPQPASVTLYVNQGMNLAGANMTSQIVSQMLIGVNAQVREQMLAAIAQKGGTLTVEQTKALASPVNVVTKNINPVGSNSANGNAPVVLSQLVWFSSLVASITLFFASKQATQHGSRLHRLGIRVSQIGVGAIAAGVAALSILLIAGKWFGMSIPDYASTGWFLFLSGFSFFLIQSTVLSWLGVAGSPLLILVFFFGAPVLALAPQMLPQISYDWLYSWLPLRFAAEGLRDLFYFRQNLNLAAPAWTLGIIAAVGAILVLLSVVKRYPEEETLQAQS